MNRVFSRFANLFFKFYTNRHLRLGLPFILTIALAPTFMQKFVEIQFLFGKTGNADSIHDEILKKHGPRKTREQIIEESYNELVESRRELLQDWEPVRVNRPWEEKDDTFMHLVTIDDLRLRD